MTSRIQREFEFQAAVFCDEFVMNTYSFSACMDVETDSIREQNIAMDRMKLFLAEYLESCVFVCHTEKKLIDKYHHADLKVCVLPEEPYDQIITIMLLSKLNAIAEGKLVITDISLASRLGDDVSFLHDIESSFGPFSKPGWWSRSDVSITDQIEPISKDKIVNLFNRQSSWADYGLGWKEKDLLVSDTNKISFIIETDK